MADWPLLGGQRWLAGARVTSAGQTIAPNASAHTKGSYAVLQTAAANVFESSGLLLNFYTVLVTSVWVDYLVDIAIGAAGSEQIVLSDFLFSEGTNAAFESILLPIQVPSGQRVAARCQASGASAPSLNIAAQFLGAPFKPSAPLSRIATYGTNTGTTRGTNVDPGGTINTKGSWSEITTSAGATFDHSYLMIVLGNQQNVARQGCSWNIDIGAGAPGSEVVIIPDLYAASDGITVYPVAFPPLPVNIPEGTRLHARASENALTDATDRTLDVALYGL